MTLLLEVKEKCKQLYANYGYAILPALKFIVAIAVFLSINSTLSFSDAADNIYILLIMALICCVLPWGVTVFLGIGLIVFQCYSVGIEVAGFAIALFLLLFIFYVRFTPDDTIALLLTPLAFVMKIPCVIPISYGLTRKPASALSTGCGVIVYYFIMLVQQRASVFQATSAEELNINKNLQNLIDSMLNNTDLFVNLVAFVAVMLTVYLIRRLSVDYARQIAIFTGAVMYIIMWVLAAMVMDVVCQYVPLIIGTIVSVVIVEIFTFFRFGLDYSRTEYHQFEDDDYFYYVKAIPKVKITEKNITVKRINEKEPEVVVEEVKVYKPKPKSEPVSGGSSGASVSTDTVAYAPVSREKARESVKEISKDDVKAAPVKEISKDDVKVAPVKEISEDDVKVAPVKEFSEDDVNIVLENEDFKEVDNNDFDKSEEAKAEFKEEMSDIDFQKKLEKTLHDL